MELIFKFLLLPVLIPMWVFKIGRPFNNRIRCPVCNQDNISVLKKGFWGKLSEDMLRLLTLGIVHKTKNLNICKECRFLWEDR